MYFLYQVLFCFRGIKQVNTKYKMNKTVNNSFLAGDKSIPEIYLTHPGLTYSTCRPFTKHEERIETFKETVDSRYIYQNELDKAYCQHDMAYGDFKDLTRRSALIKC